MEGGIDPGRIVPPRETARRGLEPHHVAGLRALRAVDDLEFHRLAFLEPLVFERTADHEADVLKITRRCTNMIEPRIRERPEPWIWISLSTTRSIGRRVPSCC